MNRDTRLSLACFLLAALAVGAGARLVWQVGRAELFASRLPVDGRYRDFLPLLPDESPFGYVSDIPRDQNDSGYRFYEVYFKAQYALVPHLLVDSTDYRFVVADLEQPSSLADICNLYGLEPVLRNARGDVVLLKHIGGPW